MTDYRMAEDYKLMLKQRRELTRPLVRALANHATLEQSEHALWFGVISQSVFDLSSRHSGVRQAAMDFLMSDDLADVACIVDLEPAYIRDLIAMAGFSDSNQGAA